MRRRLLSARRLAAKPALGARRRRPGCYRPPVGKIYQLRTAAPTRHPETVLVQAKLRVGPAGDDYEREADAVAAEVVRRITTDNKTRFAAETAPDSPIGVQPVGDVQRVADDPGGDRGGELCRADEQEIAGAIGGGRPLEPSTRSRMEGAFGADFSGVRMHAGGQSNVLNEHLGARAFTVGSDIFFSGGLPSASDRSSQTLLAHELTHTLQQGGAARRTGVSSVAGSVVQRGRNKANDSGNKTLAKKEPKKETKNQQGSGKKPPTGKPPAKANGSPQRTTTAQPTNTNPQQTTAVAANASPGILGTLYNYTVGFVTGADYQGVPFDQGSATTGGPNSQTDEKQTSDESDSTSSESTNSGNDHANLVDDVLNDAHLDVADPVQNDVETEVDKVDKATVTSSPPSSQKQQKPQNTASTSKGQKGQKKSKVKYVSPKEAAERERQREQAKALNEQAKQDVLAKQQRKSAVDGAVATAKAQISAATSIQIDGAELKAKIAELILLTKAPQSPQKDEQIDALVKVVIQGADELEQSVTESEQRDRSWYDKYLGGTQALAEEVKTTAPAFGISLAGLSKAEKQHTTLSTRQGATWKALESARATLDSAARSVSGQVDAATSHDNDKVEVLASVATARQAAILAKDPGQGPAKAAAYWKPLDAAVTEMDQQEVRYNSDLVLDPKPWFRLHDHINDLRRLAAIVHREIDIAPTRAARPELVPRNRSKPAIEEQSAAAVSGDRKGKANTAEQAAVTSAAEAIRNDQPSPHGIGEWAAFHGNAEGYLPGDKGYKEYYVLSPDGTSNGVRRIVKHESSGRLYYSWTHYGKTGDPPFVLLKF